MPDQMDLFEDRPYPKDIAPDKHNLDEDCVTLASFYDKYARATAHATISRDDISRKLSLMKGDLDLMFRGMTVGQVNERYNLQLKNLTEGAINSLILSDVGYRKLLKEHQEAASDVIAFTAARNSFEKKHAMLELLTKQHGQGYFMRVEGKEFKGAKLRHILANLREEIDRDQAVMKKVKAPDKPRRPSPKPIPRST